MDYEILHLKIIFEILNYHSRKPSKIKLHAIGLIDKVPKFICQPIVEAMYIYLSLKVHFLIIVLLLDRISFLEMRNMA